MMKDVPGYEGLYKINESGVIINKKGHVMRTAVSNSGYLRTALLLPDAADKNDRKNESVHRLVAKTFIPNPDNLPVVMHKDNDPLNNHVSNLEWGTQSDNIQQSFDEGRKETPNKGLKYDKNMKFVYEIYSDSGDVKRCIGRSEVSETIGYSEISLKNMVGNGRVIDQGIYKGYQIRRLDKKAQHAIISLDNTFND